MAYRFSNRSTEKPTTEKNSRVGVEKRTSKGIFDGSFRTVRLVLSACMDNAVFSWIGRVWAVLFRSLFVIDTGVFCSWKFSTVTF